MSKILIRKATIADLPALTTIYNQAIQARQTADTVPMSVSDRTPWFEAHQNPKYPLFVATQATAILGYATLSQYRGGRPALRYAVEVSYYIHKDRQRKGTGSLLLSYALQVAKELDFRHAIAILLDTNLPSISLLEKFGFERWGHLPNIAEIDGQTCGHLYYGKGLIRIM